MAQQKDTKTGKWMYYGSYVDIDGKRKQYKKRGFDTKKEAIKAEITFRDHAEHGSKFLSFEDVYKRYLNYHKKQVKQSSIETDKFIYQRLIKVIDGSMKYTDKEFFKVL